MTASDIYIPVITTLLTIFAVFLGKRIFGAQIHAYLSHDHYGKTPIIEIRKRRIEGKTAGLNKFDREADVHHSAIYIRLSVVKRGIGTLKGCQAHLVDVTFTPLGGDESRRVFWDSIPLCWSFTESERVDIPSSVRMMLAVCSTREDLQDLRLCTQIVPNHYKFAEAGTYRFKVSISAENEGAIVNVKCIDVVWNGKWDEIDVKAVEC